MTRCLRLADRLQGNYVLPVNDGAGPLDGKMTFERQFQMDHIQITAGSMIDRLEAGEPHTNVGIELVIEKLLEKKDWAGLGLEPYVAPINYQAVEELKKYLD